MNHQFDKYIQACTNEEPRIYGSIFSAYCSNRILCSHSYLECICIKTLWSV